MCPTNSRETAPTEGEKEMRQLVILLAVMATALLLGAGVAFAQTIIGDAGDNRLVGTSGADFISGKEGDDTLYGKKKNDELRGKEGNDTLYGGPGDDILKGGPGNDILYAGQDNDQLRPGSGNDEVYGGAGNDVLYMRDGETDVGDCGPGTDTAVTFESIDQPAPGTEPYANCERIGTPIEP
jgi:Ca2+-binding RTX toxin-like protein